MKTDKVLVALDLDANPEALAQQACELSASLSAELIVLTVLPVKPSVDADVLKFPAAHPVEAKHFREEEEAVLPRLKAIAQAVRDAGVRVSAQVAHGDVADAILHVATKLDVGLIVVGTHGRHGIARVALGSVAESVIREAPVPVVAIRAGVLPAKDRVSFHEIALDEEGA